MGYPLVWLTGVFAFGIAAAHLLAINFVFAYMTAVLCLAVCLFCRDSGPRFKYSLVCLIFLLGVLWLTGRLYMPRDHIWRHIFYKTDNSCVLKCFVKSDPSHRYGRTLFIVEAQEALFGRINYHIRGDVYVSLKGRMSLAYGDKLVLEGRLSRPYRKQAAKGNKKSARIGRLQAVMNVDGPLFVTVNGKGGGLALMRTALNMKNAVTATIHKYVRPPASGVLEAMLLGEKADIPPLVYQSMIKTGTVHILVVSGFNTSMVIFCVFLLLKFMRIPRSRRLFFALPVLFFYCLMAGASASIIRATIMSVVFMAAYLSKREPDIYNTCALSALIILLIDPGQLFNIGCQLSFASVISIVFFYPRIKALMRLKGKKPFCFRFFSEGFIVSLSAWVGTAPLVAYYFKIFSPITLIANIFIVPLAGLITLCGFSLVAAAALALPVVTPAFAVTAQALVAVLLRINALFLHLPGAYFHFTGA